MKPAAAPKQALIKMIQGLARRVDTWTVFSDFVELAALAISNAVDPRQFDAREARYFEVIKGYEKDELAQFQQMLGELTLALENERTDVLGQVFMQLELGNKWAGQFFTPQCVCDLMAGITLHDVEETLARQEFITISEPACGGGAMLIGIANHLHGLGINYQRRMHITAVDVDIKAVHMTYVQLSLLGVPAVVVHGNTLMLEERSHWFTPMHMLGLWGAKLRRRAPAEAPPAVRAPTMPLGEQLDLGLAA